MPTESTINRKFKIKVENSHFKNADEKYLAKVESGKAVQAVWEGRNMDRGETGIGEEIQYPPQFSTGTDWELDNNDGSATALKIRSEKFTKLAGSTVYGRIFRNLLDKFGVEINDPNKTDAQNAAVNKKRNELFDDLFKQPLADGKSFVQFGPEGLRFLRNYGRKHKAFPDPKNGAIYNGCTFQMDKEEFMNDGKKGERTVPVALLAIEDEHADDYAAYLTDLAKLGGEAPKTEAPKATNGTSAKTTAETVAETKPEVKAEVKVEAKKEEAATTPVATTAVLFSDLPDEDIFAKLLELASELPDREVWKVKALELFKGKSPRWITWCVKPENYKALEAHLEKGSDPPSPPAPKSK